MVAFERGPNNRRMKVIMLIVAITLIIGPIFGEESVMYLFTRYRFNWNEVDFSIFATYATCTSLIGMFLAIGVFSHIWGFDDAVIGIIASISKILAIFAYAFATETWQIYTAPLIEIFRGASSTATRSMLSKIVDKHQLGKVNSLFGMAEAMTPLVYAPIYTSLYTHTLNVLPGAFFLLSGGVTVPALVIFVWLYIVKKKQTRISQEHTSVENETQANNLGVGFDNRAFE